MDPSFIPYVTGGGGALVVLAFVAWAFFTGKLHSDREFTKLETENSDLKAENDAIHEALRTERRASDDIADTAKVTNKLIDTLATLALERRVLKPGNVTPEDLGL